MNIGAGLLEEIIGNDTKIRYIKKQRGYVKHTAADIKKAPREIGYEPNVKLRKGLELQVEWMEELC